jgi:hypothetical protein
VNVRVKAADRSPRKTLSMEGVPSQVPSRVTTSAKPSLFKSTTAKSSIFRGQAENGMRTWRNVVALSAA